MASESLRIVPIKHAKANDFVRRFHRHHRPTVGAIFCVGVADELLRGVAIVGRPVARALDDGATVEVNRVATDGARNACSMLLGACRRIARAMGYVRVITYTLPSEGGASLRAAGYTFDGEAGGPSALWANRPGRDAPALDGDLVNGKWRWVA
jgi:hypothetical protein